MHSSSVPAFIPRPLVRTNQWTIVLSVVLSWATGFGWLLLIPLLAGLGGLLFDYNPIMKFARRFLRKKPGEYIPEDIAQQKFNQVIATICLAGGLVSYLYSWTIAYFIFTIMVGLAAAIAIAGFCIGCFILFQWNQFQYRRKNLKNQQ